LKTIHCSIITIGDELLIGQTIDTNSAWIAQKLNQLGIWVKYRIAVGDVREDILGALEQESRRSSLVILTGGLGPTADDITKPLLCEYFHSNLVENQEVLQHVTEIFTARKRPMLETNLRQALVPDNCAILFNEVGTAPGMWFEQNEVVFISLPGVPFEMQHIMTKRVLPKLAETFETPQIHHFTLVTSGEGESFIAHRLKDFEAGLPNYLKLAYLPKLGVVKLRLTGIDVPTSVMEPYINQMKGILSSILVSDQDIELEQAVFQLLSSNGETLSIAESCTGGQLCARITSIKGSSEVFKGGLVPYSVEAKINVLGVSSSTIQDYGVISEETVIEMANRCRNIMNSTYALSISGHLEKQEDETFVWIGLSQAGKSVAKKVHVYYDREKNATMITNTALNLLRLFILKKFQVA
jgi:nicotinamide-nucleotide amidase